MTTFIKAMLKKSYDQANTDKYRVDATEYHILSKSIFRNHHSKIHEDTPIISCKNVCKKKLKSTCLKWTQGLIIHNYRVTTLSTFYSTVSGIIKMSLKLLGQLLFGENLSYVSRILSVSTEQSSKFKKNH